MPYIKQEDRHKWDDLALNALERLVGVPDDKVEGELNYFITKLLHIKFKPSYHNYNKVIGLLECIKQEYYRREVATYEDIKIDENGDV